MPHDELEERVRERTASLARTNERLQTEIDERERSDRRLAAAAARLARARRRARERVLEARFAAVLEERTRLAREIHDTLLQGFTGVSFQGDDFAAALRAALDRTLACTPLAFDYAVREVPRALDSEVEIVAFLVAQEAVANVLKHAAARTVHIVLSYERRSVRLVVADDGRGFVVDPDLQTYAGHWGLLGMRERASQLRAKLAVRSAPGEGTKIVLLVPSHAARRRTEKARTRSPVAT